MDSMFLRVLDGNKFAENKVIDACPEPSLAAESEKAGSPGRSFAG